MKTARSAPKHTDHSIRVALRKRCAPPAWALVEEVRDNAGFKATRSADAVAMSLWPSRGLELHGFEIKASRSDWTRERDNPDKADPIATYCDRWWLVVGDAAIVKDGELPPTWGLLAMRGDTLVTIREAEKRKATPISRGFLACLLRRATEHQAVMVPKDEVETRVASQVAERLATEIASANPEAARAVKLLPMVEAALGVNLYDKWNLPSIKAAYDLVMSGTSRENYLRELEHNIRTAETATRSMKETLAKARAVFAPADGQNSSNGRPEP